MSIHPRGELHVYDDARAASLALAESFAERARAAVEAQGRFSVALTGGSGPRTAYRLLGEEPFRSRIPWKGVHLFWGDERCVPPAHPRSNFGMAREAFAGRVPIPPENVHRMRGELRPPDAAEAYARELERLFGGGIPALDLVHLGLGEDAHVCSLFPFDPLLRERERTVGTALRVPPGEWRISLTFPVLNAARRVELIVPGRRKAEAVRRAARGPLDPFRLPAQGVRPVSGELHWLLDREAAP